LVEVSLVTLAGRLTCVSNRDVARELERVLDVVAERRVAEAARRFLEALRLVVERLHVLQVTQELAIRERVLDDLADARREIRLAVADVLQELVEGLVGLFTLEALQDLREVVVDRLILRLELSDDRLRVLVLAVREVNDRFDDLRFRIIRVREVRALD